MAYQPIDHYGIIGDLQTVALVGRDGSIDWFCYPRFDSPSVFGAILDERKGGRFQITSLCEGAKHKQFYWPDTNVLVTRFFTTDGVGELTDFMPVGGGCRRIIRRLRVTRGRMRFRMCCLPAFDYARARHQTRVTGDAVFFETPALTLRLTSSVGVYRVDGGVEAELTLAEDDVALFVLDGLDCDALPAPLAVEESDAVLLETIGYWRRWLSHCTYHGRWRETVQRSALALKLLTYEPTGAIVAAPTCSLPEDLGGERNWDYRYTWIRDAAFTVYGLMRIGFTEEAGRFVDWIEHRCNELGPDQQLQIMYAVDGQPLLHEETLDHLEGYRGSRPVRIGNGAHQQLQLDIYGELLDSVYLYNKYGSPVSYDLWAHLRSLVDWVADNWQREDEGIWEVRGGARQFVYSKLMCWVALDRALRLAGKRSFPAPLDKWIAARDAVYEAIMTRGWSAKRQAFVQSLDGEALDAANLMMPLVFFVSPTDERMLSTLDATMVPVARGGLVSNSLVYRYDVEATRDGLQGYEGTFNICTFWLVEAMTRAGKKEPRRLDQARLIFEEMLGYASHLGLYAEETGPTGEGLGNFPQAFTHLGLISAAFNLDRTLGAGKSS